MANKRLDMRNILQLLRLYTQGVSKLQISRQLGLSRNTVKKEHLFEFIYTAHFHPELSVHLSRISNKPL